MDEVRGEGGIELRTMSVVIPVLNEAASLPETVKRLWANPEIKEVIVVDGGSRDETRQVATNLNCVVLESLPGRGTQMRRGAELATGDALLLLHADTWLPSEGAQAALRCLQDGTVAGGGFWKQFRDAPLLLRGSRAKCALRLWLGGRVAGDQGLFMRRETLAAVGGVPEIPLMEEFELCKRLRTRGRLALADAVVLTSARRFRERGVLRTYGRMWHVMIRYWMGTPPERLRGIYEGNRGIGN